MTGLHNQTNEKFCGKENSTFGEIAIVIIYLFFSFLANWIKRRRPHLGPLLWCLWLYQKGNKKQVNPTDSMQAEHGEEMGSRFAEMIPPDTDPGDILLRERELGCFCPLRCDASLDSHFHPVYLSLVCLANE